MSFGVVITATGPLAPTYADIVAALKTQFRAIYGNDIYLEADSQDGQQILVFARAVKDVNDGVVAAYNAMSPATAQGVGLSSVVKINGLKRLAYGFSTALVSIGGTVGTQINGGQIKDSSNNIWDLPAVVVIPGSGTIDVTATCETPGAINAGINAFTIASPTRGWQTVTNAAAATPGAPVETDAQLRQRQSVSTSIPALSTVDSILGAIRNITGVERSWIYENSTNAPDANGIPAHTIAVVVEGGDATTIAETIQLYKTPGTGTYGTTAEVVTDPLGITTTIHFYFLTLIPMSFLVYLTGNGYASSTGTLITGAIAEWINSLVIGGDSLFSKLWSPVNLTGDAALNSSGQSQAQLESLANTYNATAIYQARSNMTLTAQTVAGANTFHLTSVANFANGNKVAIALSDGSFLLTTITNIAALVVTTLDNVPGILTANIGALVYVQGDIVMAFNEAASANVASTILEVS